MALGLLSPTQKKENKTQQLDDIEIDNFDDNDDKNAQVVVEMVEDDNDDPQIDRKTDENKQEINKHKTLNY